MKEKRREERLKEENEITITIISGKDLPKEKVLYNYSKDISMSGTKIQTNILLPINTLLNIDFTLKNLHKKITALGKVKWIKIIFEDESYEAGVEFVDTPDEAIKKLEDYISWKRKNTSLNPVGFPFKSSEN
jgi:hypothetical protein